MIAAGRRANRHSSNRQIASRHFCWKIEQSQGAPNTNDLETVRNSTSSSSTKTRALRKNLSDDDDDHTTSSSSSSYTSKETTILSFSSSPTRTCTSIVLHCKPRSRQKDPWAQRFMTKIFTTHNNFYFVKNFDLQPKAFMSSTKTQIFHHLQQQLLLLLLQKTTLICLPKASKSSETWETLCSSNTRVELHK